MADPNQPAPRSLTAPIGAIGRPRSGGFSLTDNADPVIPDQIAGVAIVARNGPA